MERAPKSGWMSSLRTVVFAALTAAVLLGIVAGELSPFVGRVERQRVDMLMRGGDTFARMYYLAWDAGWSESSSRPLMLAAADLYASALKSDLENLDARLCTMFALRVIGKPVESRLLLRPVRRGSLPESSRKGLSAAYAIALSDSPAPSAMETAHDFLFEMGPGPALIANGYREIGDEERAAETMAEAAEQARELLRGLLTVVAVNGIVVLFGVVMLLWAVVRRVRRGAVSEEPGPLPMSGFGMREATEAMILVVFVGAAIVRLATAMTPEGGEPPVLFVLAPTVAAEVGAIAWVWGATGFRARLGWALSGAWRRVLVGVGAAGVTVVPVLGVYTLAQRWLGSSAADDPIVPLLVAPDTVFSKVLLVALVGLLGPALEETLFRGIVFGALRRQWSFWPAAGAASALFAVAHANPAGIPAYFVLGLVFAYLVERTRSLVTPWAAHAAFNLFNLAMLLALFG